MCNTENTLFKILFFLMGILFLVSFGSILKPSNASELIVNNTVNEKIMPQKMPTVIIFGKRVPDNKSVTKI